MRSIVFASQNIHKVREINEILGGKVNIIGLEDIGCREELAETSDTVEGNALQKARYVYEHYQVDCFSEDTGLEIDALDGAPGVYTARYAGPRRDPDDNMNLVLQKLKGEKNRRACFRTVIALIIDGQEYLFEGVAEGRIGEQKAGSGGFGYDPLFIPEGFNLSFAEMDPEIKNAISHRSKAVEKLRAFLAAL